MYQKYHRGLKEQLDSSGLVLNFVVPWHTRHAEAILSRVQGIAESVLDKDVARISPLKYAHINVPGRYPFEMFEAVAAGGDLRLPLDPDNLDTLERLWKTPKMCVGLLTCFCAAATLYPPTLF